MDDLITISLDAKREKVLLSQDFIKILRDLFGGCRVSFLFGAGFSANLLSLLGNKEELFDALHKYQYQDESQKLLVKKLEAYLYWSFFKECIAPIAYLKEGDATTDDKEESLKKFTPYLEFGNIVYKIFSHRSNPTLERQFNIFTTNYDPIFELIFDNSGCICNDGFEGRIKPRFTTDNYTKSYYRQAMFSNRKAEIPSLNLLKLHGSLTWGSPSTNDSIPFQHYDQKIKDFADKYRVLFDQYMQAIEQLFTAYKTDIATTLSLLISNNFNALPNTPSEEECAAFIDDYQKSFLIVSPTKEKFSHTLLNKNYYELLRIFSNELEKENTLLIAYGFSFKDEHILDLVKRSLINPSLKILIFIYDLRALEELQVLFKEVKNNNITYIILGGANMSLDFFNQILDHIHC